MTAIRSVDIVIRGRVQGVGYRFWTLQQAEKRGVSGHVRNRSDGTVEAALSGPADTVSALIEACRQGPRGARVEAVTVTERDGAGIQDGFFILHD